MTWRYRIVMAGLLVIWAIAQGRSFVVPVDPVLLQYIAWHGEVR